MGNAGIFRLRGVLVGTVAFQTYAGHLGVKLLGASLQTSDADFAQHYSISSQVEDSLPPVLEFCRGSTPTFRAIPHRSDPRRVTQFENAARYKVEFLTPNRGSDEYADNVSPMPVLGGASAQPLRFLDFLIHEPIRTVMLHRSGVPVIVPAPERYAVHKLIVASRNRVIARAAERMKSGHDIIVNGARRREPAGGMLARIDSVGQGRVQVLPAGANELTQAAAAVGELERLSRIGLDWDWSSAAVIARNWRSLEPVRSLCEARGIPVQLATESVPGFWRLRETQALVRWLDAQSETVVEPARLLDWLEMQGDDSWWAVLRESVAALTQETGHSSILVPTMIDWLADWGRELRRRQTGLLLLTAHRAKGLEFNDVVVLDGGWDRPSQGEDCDALRRLYYVAMTRARRSLALMQFDRRHVILDGLLNDNAFLLRRETAGDIDISDCIMKYLRLKLSELDLSFAGRLPERSPTIEAISLLEPGAPVQIKTRGDQVYLIEGHAVGRLAKKFRAPTDCRFIRGQVVAAVERRAEDSDEAYRKSLRRTKWEVIVPELVFGPKDADVP